MKRMILVCWLCLAATSVYAEGDWIADAKTGCKVWNPVPVSDETITWSGKCKDGKADGKGTLEWYKNSELYSTIGGVMQDGRCAQECSAKMKNGDSYTGEMKDNLLHGKGTYIGIDWKYSGDLKNNIFHGEGIMIDKNGDKYSGSWSEGKQHGKGTYTFKDGTSYEGLWEHGNRIKIF